MLNFDIIHACLETLPKMRIRILMLLLLATVVKCGQLSYTIDSTSDNAFFHELISPSISNSNIRQNTYSRFGEIVNVFLPNCNSNYYFTNLQDRR